MAAVVESRQRIPCCEALELQRLLLQRLGSFLDQPLEPESHFCESLQRQHARDQHGEQQQEDLDLHPVPDDCDQHRNQPRRQFGGGIEQAQRVAGRLSAHPHQSHHSRFVDDLHGDQHQHDRAERLQPEMAERYRTADRDIHQTGRQHHQAHQAGIRHCRECDRAQRYPVAQPVPGVDEGGQPVDPRGIDRAEYQDARNLRHAVERHVAEDRMCVPDRDREQAEQQEEQQERPVLRGGGAARQRERERGHPAGEQQSAIERLADPWAGPDAVGCPVSHVAATSAFALMRHDGVSGPPCNTSRNSARDALPDRASRGLAYGDVQTRWACGSSFQP